MAVVGRERLAKLCGMFGRDRAGERATVTAAADRLVREMGLRWPDVILPPRSEPRNEPRIETVADAVEFTIRHCRKLNARERGFLNSIRSRQSLCRKQLAVLHELFYRARGETG